MEACRGNFARTCRRRPAVSELLAVQEAQAAKEAEEAKAAADSAEDDEEASTSPVAGAQPAPLTCSGLDMLAKRLLGLSSPHCCWW